MSALRHHFRAHAPYAVGAFAALTTAVATAVFGGNLLVVLAGALIAGGCAMRLASLLRAEDPWRSFEHDFWRYVERQQLQTQRDFGSRRDRFR